MMLMAVCRASRPTCPVTAGVFRSRTESTKLPRHASVALVHDWLTGMRGGEKVLEVFCELWPQADIFTLLHVPGSVSATIERHRIKTELDTARGRLEELTLDRDDGLDVVRLGQETSQPVHRGGGGRRHGRHAAGPETETTVD